MSCIAYYSRHRVQCRSQILTTSLKVSSEELRSLTCRVLTVFRSMPRMAVSATLSPSFELVEKSTDCQNSFFFFFLADLLAQFMSPKVSSTPSWIRSEESHLLL